MTLTISNLANAHAQRVGAAPAERGLARALRDLAYATVRPVRHMMFYRKMAGELLRLDDEVLSDIGLDRWDVRFYARCRAELRWPARPSFRAALVRVAAAASAALKRGRERRMSINDLMALDERMLKDIGLSRSQIPWVVDEMVRTFTDFGMPSAEHPAVVKERAKLDDGLRLGGRTLQGLVPSGGKTLRRLANPANDSRMLKAS